jgi:hypothetical protein
MNGKYALEVPVDDDGTKTELNDVGCWMDSSGSG